MSEPTDYDLLTAEKVTLWLDDLIEQSEGCVSRDIPFTDQRLNVAFAQRRSLTSLSIVLNDGATYIVSVESLGT